MEIAEKDLDEELDKDSVQHMARVELLEGALRLVRVDGEITVRNALKAAMSDLLEKRMDALKPAAEAMRRAEG